MATSFFRKKVNRLESNLEKAISVPAFKNQIIYKFSKFHLVMEIQKSSGEFQRFSPKKIYHSVLDAGGSKKLANNAVKEIKRLLHERISTEEILKILLNFLKKEPGVSQRYDLKRAIMSLGPTGFPFEQYFAKLLNYYGYKTRLNSKLKGKKIIQEVDIIAMKNKKFMIEAKYHNEIGIITRLHPAMYTYARFLDLKKYNFDQPWLVTNTKCSRDAVEYSKGVNLKITSWNYPKKESLKKMISNEGLYPITILKSLSPKLKEKLYEEKMVTLKDLEKYSPEALRKKFQLKEKEASNLLKEINEILS